MKRKKILALALAITTAVSTLAPNTGFLSAIVAQAQESGKLTYASGDGGVFDEISAVDLNTTSGGNFELKTVEDKAGKYTFKEWQLTGVAGVTTGAAGSIIEYG